MDNKDLAMYSELKYGARSITVGSSAGDWIVYDNYGYEGDHKFIYQGKVYELPEAMGLNGPVKSIRRA